MKGSRLPAALLPSAALVVAGFVAFGMSWLGLSTETLLAQQVAWVVSGALTGIGLIVVGASMFSLQLRRQNAAFELEALEVATRDAREIAACLAEVRRR